MTSDASKPPIGYQRGTLPLLGVLIECLDEHSEPIPEAVASGFIRREFGRLFLYTCWHVVTDFDPYDLAISPKKVPSRRRYLRLAFQGARRPIAGLEIIGGLQTLKIGLYKNSERPFQAAWLQDDAHIPNADLNSLGLHVPFWHDLVKIELPAEIEVSDLQIVDEKRIFPGNTSLIAPGDKCLIVGFPYGFSAFGRDQPTPIALTRFVASDRIAGRRRQLLLDSIAAPGMSGGPVFVERDNELLLFGIYTGLIYPDFYRQKRDGVTALGSVADITFALYGHLPLVTCPSQAVDVPRP